MNGRQRVSSTIGSECHFSDTG